jgi:hypothetical protein
MRRWVAIATRRCAALLSLCAHANSVRVNLNLTVFVAQEKGTVRQHGLAAASSTDHVVGAG